MTTARDAAGPPPGLYDSPWPAEDGGPRRQLVPRTRGLGVRAGERLGVTFRSLFVCNMVVLRAPGEVYLQGSTSFSADGAVFVERVDPVSLEPLRRSPDLELGGAWWPGGIVAHRNGFLYVTQGTFCHKLDADCTLVASRRLPRPQAYNSLLVLSDGNLVMKNMVFDGSARSAFVVLEPDELRPVGPEVEIPEGSIARISKDLSDAGEHVYVVGDHTIFRLRYAGGRLALDDWRVRYLTASDAEQSYGWDPVIAGGHTWFLDNGANTFSGSFRGGGTATGPIHLVRVSLADARDWELMTPFGVAHGTVANPPAFEPDRRIAVAYDSGNARIAAFRFDGPGRYARLWDHPFGAANHFLLYPDTGEIAVNDFQEGVGEHVVVLDLETGRELGRVATGSPVQSVVFQAPGFGRDLYTCAFAGVARVEVR
ncbi:MAG TPA: hypothetical protein VMS22_18580 [Candidatus Eisenbacteria bacterium]|nr:hypothetical protein [Candidatus Eisenbacteria bacterium]